MNPYQIFEEEHFYIVYFLGLQRFYKMEKMYFENIWYFWSYDKKKSNLLFFLENCFQGVPNYRYGGSGQFILRYYMTRWGVCVSLTQMEPNFVIFFD